MESPYLDRSCKSEGDGAHEKSLSESAVKILGRWRPWEILFQISHGNPRATVRMGNPYQDQPSKSKGDGAPRAWEILIRISHGNPLARAMACMGNPYLDQIWK